MRVFVKLYDKDGRETDTHVIAFHETSRTISSFKREVLRRLGSDDADGEQFRLTLAGNGAKLRESDAIEDVLRDGDYLCLCPDSVPRSEAHDPGALPSYGHALCEALINTKTAEWIELDGNSLGVEDLMKIGRGQYRVKLSDASAQTVCRAREVVGDIVNNHRVVYGITTGFGKFAHVVIPCEKLEELQVSLIRSHSSGVGSPLSPEQTRRMITLRINVLAKGFSGVRLETLQQLLDALNASCLPYIPAQGTVGASGDLAPLSHLALGMMGEGKMWSPETGWDSAKWVLEAHGLKPIRLAAKEGLCLINGTQLITALGAEALFSADMAAKQADIIAALSLDVLQGTPRAFDYDIHSNRPHPGQQMVAARLRALLDSSVHPSEIRAGHIGCSRVQDPYTLRCIPQVHGVVWDTINFVRGILTTEMNSALDNPMVFTERREVISGGNFHGEYPAKALDYLAIGVHELANMSERRLERLVNPASSDLPAFLVKEGGLNSGFMLAHCTAAALVSENKVLTHPSSVDSISTSAGQEDHVSMGGYAARKALQVVQHVEQVLAIELLAACQALEFHRPKKTTAPLEEVYRLMRSVVRSWDKDRFMAPDIEAATALLREGKVWEVVKPYIESYQEQASEPPAARLQIVDQHK